MLRNKPIVRVEAPAMAPAGSYSRSMLTSAEPYPAICGQSLARAALHGVYRIRGLRVEAKRRGEGSEESSSGNRPDRPRPSSRPQRPSSRPKYNKGKNYENNRRRRGRPEWLRSPDDTPLRDGNRDRVIGLLTQRAARTLCYYLSETNPNVYHWLTVFMKEHPIPRDGAWDDVSGENFLRQLLSMSIEHANYNAGTVYTMNRGCGVDPRNIAQRIMETLSKNDFHILYAILLANLQPSCPRASLALQIRTQIATEMIQDLKDVAEENSLLMRETIQKSFSLNLNNVASHPVGSSSSAAGTAGSLAPPENEVADASERNYTASEKKKDKSAAQKIDWKAAFFPGWDRVTRKVSRDQARKDTPTPNPTRNKEAANQAKRDLLTQLNAALEKAKSPVEEQQDGSLGEKEAVSDKKDTAFEQHKAVSQQKDEVVEQRDGASEQRDTVSEQMDTGSEQMDTVSEHGVSEQGDTVSEQGDPTAKEDTPQEQDGIVQRLNAALEKTDAPQTGSSIVDQLNAALGKTESIPEKKDSGLGGKEVPEDKKDILDRLNAAFDAGANKATPDTRREKSSSGQGKKEIVDRLNAAFQNKALPQRKDALQGKSDLERKKAAQAKKEILEQLNAAIEKKDGSSAVEKKDGSSDKEAPGAFRNDSGGDQEKKDAAQRLDASLDSPTSSASLQAEKKNAAQEKHDTFDRLNAAIEKGVDKATPEALQNDSSNGEEKNEIANLLNPALQSNILPEKDVVKTGNDRVSDQNENPEGQQPAHDKRKTEDSSAAEKGEGGPDKAPKDSGSDNVNRLNAALQETDSVPDKQDVAPENKAAAQERRTIIDQLNAALDTPESATEKKDATAPEKRVTAQERRDILAKLNAALQKADSVLDKIENPDTALERDRHAQKKKVQEQAKSSTAQWRRNNGARQDKSVRENKKQTVSEKEDVHKKDDMPLSLIKVTEGIIPLGRGTPLLGDKDSESKEVASGQRDAPAAEAAVVRHPDSAPVGKDARQGQQKGGKKEGSDLAAKDRKEQAAGKEEPGSAVSAVQDTGETDARDSVQDKETTEIARLHQKAPSGGNARAVSNGRGAPFDKREATAEKKSRDSKGKGRNSTKGKGRATPAKKDTPWAKKQGSRGKKDVT